MSLTTIFRSLAVQTEVISLRASIWKEKNDRIVEGLLCTIFVIFFCQSPVTSSTFRV